MAELEGDPSVFVLEIGPNQYTIPDDTDTTYYDFCVNIEDALADMGQSTDDELFIIGIEFVQDPASAGYVHHLVVHGTQHPLPESDRTEQNHCSETACYRGRTCGSLRDVIWPWAPGQDWMKTPDVAAFRALGPSGYRALDINVHYDNPHFVSQITDDSKIKIYLTRQWREFEIGVLQLGDGPVHMSGQTVKTGEGLYSSHTFVCEKGLLGRNAGEDIKVKTLACWDHTCEKGVHVFNRAFHMHASGEVMTSAVKGQAASVDDGCQHLSLKRYEVRRDWSLSIQVCSGSDEYVGDFTGDYCPAWLNYTQSCPPEGCPTPEETPPDRLAGICLEWSDNSYDNDCYRSTRASPKITYEVCMIYARLCGGSCAPDFEAVARTVGKPASAQPRDTPRKGMPHKTKMNSKVQNPFKPVKKNKMHTLAANVEEAPVFGDRCPVWLDFAQNKCPAWLDLEEGGGTDCMEPTEAELMGESQSKTHAR